MSKAVELFQPLLPLCFDPCGYSVSGYLPLIVHLSPIQFTCPKQGIDGVKTDSQADCGFSWAKEFCLLHSPLEKDDVRERNVLLLLPPLLSCLGAKEMTILPFNRFVRCGFYTPILNSDVRLEGSQISGKWGEAFTDFYGEKGILIAQRFANWPTDKSKIFEFTKRYGPLTESPSDGSSGFRFSLEEWKVSQRHIRNSWKSLMSQGADVFFPEENILLEFGPKQLVLQCSNLKTFMYLEMSSCADKLRFCEREGCTHPYFVPHHGKERYCSTDCSNWAQSQWKKRWHEEQRKKKDSKQKGKRTDGTQKAR
jgi:hypothetical protein